MNKMSILNKINKFESSLNDSKAENHLETIGRPETEPEKEDEYAAENVEYNTMVFMGPFDTPFIYPTGHEAKVIKEYFNELLENKKLCYFRDKVKSIITELNERKITIAPLLYRNNSKKKVKETDIEAERSIKCYEQLYEKRIMQKKPYIKTYQKRNFPQ